MFHRSGWHLISLSLQVTQTGASGDAYLIAVAFYILGIVADLLFCLPVQTRWTRSDQILSVVAKKILAAVRVMGAVFSRCGT